MRESKPVRLSSLFGPDEVACALGELSGQEAIKRLLEAIGRQGYLRDVGSAYDLIVTKQCCSVAHLTDEVVVVHARIEALAGLRLAMAVEPGGIECRWAEGASSPLKLLILILTPSEEPAGYLRTLSALRRICAKPGFLTRLLRLGSPEAVWRCFKELDEELPVFVTAGDMMNKDFHALRNENSLSDAIDAFCQLRVTELPVMDEDGDLVGVVSEDELIRLCLPDYITWMEDLSPILDFQPFAEILSREQDMPVVEIMVMAERYATVEESAPAIQVAKVMMRRDVKQVLVVRGQRLVGVISIQDFINKVLRA